MSIGAGRRRRAALARLSERIGALTEAAALSEGRVEDGVVERARGIAERADQRLALGEGNTIVALSGATGSGKSSLLNALSGARLARDGARRPTTRRAMAACWGPANPDELLDWLGVPVRMNMGPSKDLDGLVLVDLPDNDSIEHEDKLEVDRLIDLVDMVIWVVDPQKYADAALHEGYLRSMADHADVMVAVLNQVDRLAARQLAQTESDLRGLLDAEGLHGVPLLCTSALTGTGVDDLIGLLAGTARAKRAGPARLDKDVTSAAVALSEAIGADVPTRVDPDRAKQLDAALARAAGVGRVGEAVFTSISRRGQAATGWPVVSWVQRLRPDPLRRLRLDPTAGAEGGVPGDSEPTCMSRAGLRIATGGVEQARVDTALRAIGDDSSCGLPQGWADAVRSASRGRAGRLPAELDRAVASADLELARGQWWWRPVLFLQWLLLAAVVAGLGWLGINLLLARLGTGAVPVLIWWGIPAPVVLADGGAVAGIVLGVLARFGVVAGAHATRRRAIGALMNAVSEVSGQAVIGPIEAELERHRDALAAVRRAISVS
ncbi:GTPase [uncultured Propionibacterium sp.]|uniref:GTPase n=1 Tax=uncultured Propionibacterium sp. TaxID=218066 RepID=UPI00292FEEB5|nr:GTPase [uncultured Propionibacterium sp.]